jgi:hypothetical protein
MMATPTETRQHRKTWTEEVRHELDRAMEHELQWRASMRRERLHALGAGDKTAAAERPSSKLS